MAAPTYRGKGTYASGTTSAVIDIDGITGHASGDLLLIIVESSDSTTAAGTPTTPTGWTSIFEFTGSPGATGVSTLTIFAKIHDGSEADVTVNGVLNHISGTMFAVETGTHGVSNVATDIVVGSGTDHGTGTTGLSTSGITVTADSLIFHVVGVTDDALDTTNVSNVVNSNLASITEREDNATNTGAGGGIGVTTATCAGTTTGATTWDHDTAAISESVHIGIPPAASGTPATVTPATITQAIAIPTATPQAAASVTPATIARSFTTPQTGPQAASVVTPTTVARSFLIDQVQAGVSATVTPATIAAIAAVLPFGAGAFDSFNRADSGTLGTSDSGHVWTSDVGTWGIVSNQASQTSATASAQASIDLGTPDQVVEADLVHASAQQYVMARYTTAPSGYIAGFQVSSNTLTLWKFNPGFTSLGTFAASAHTGRVRLEVIGSTQKVYLDGVERISTTDGAITTGNRAGMFGQSALIDNWNQVGGGAQAKGAANVTPDTISRAVVLPQASAGVAASVTPVTVARTFVVPQSSAQAGVLVTPATIARAFLVPQTNPQASASVTPATIARAFALPQAAPKAAVLVTPGTAAMLVTIPQAIAGADTVAQPATLAALVGVPQAQVQAAVSVTPATFAALVGIPQADAIGAASATVTPATIAAAFGIPEAQAVTIAALVITHLGPRTGGIASGSVVVLTKAGASPGGTAAGLDETGDMVLDGISETGATSTGDVDERGELVTSAAPVLVTSRRGP